MVDNIELILPLLEFDNSDDFYYLQILQRKKENKDQGKNSRVIKNYYISSTEYLLRKYSEIKLLCDNFNARALIRLNKRSYSKVNIEAIRLMLTNLEANQNEFSIKSFDRACGRYNNQNVKRWILDVDNQDYDTIKTILTIITPFKPEGEKLIKVIPSKTGHHIITSPFNVQEYNQFAFLREIEIHKDNPTNLYIPNGN